MTSVLGNTMINTHVRYLTLYWLTDLAWSLKTDTVISFRNNVLSSQRRDRDR